MSVSFPDKSKNCYEASAAILLIQETLTSFRDAMNLGEKLRKQSALAKGTSRNVYPIIREADK